MADLHPIQALIAFKHLQGKSHTADNKAVGNEAESIELNIHSDYIFIDHIGSNPDYATSSLGGNVAEYIEADVVSDITSNSQAFFLN